MLTSELKRQLELIFSDATLIDVDFSKWDKFISFVFVSDHYERYEMNAFRPILEIKFYDVTDVHFEFWHHERNVFVGKPDKHIQWNIDQSEIDKLGKKYNLSFYESGLMPKVFIKFSRIEIEKVDHKFFNTINPKWAEPNSGFARPGIKDIFKNLSHTKTKKK